MSQFRSIAQKAELCGNRHNSGFVMILLLLVMALGVSAWVSLGITTRDRWPIRWLELQGRFERVSAEQLRASLLPTAHSSFFTVDLDALRGTATRMHWVSAARVQKRWPDTVVVTVEEFQPVAHWNGDQLVSIHGEIFTVPEARNLQGLPWLEGQDRYFTEILDRWADFNQALAVHGLEISRLEQDRRGSWEMTLNNMTHVRIGRDATGERLERLLASWPVLLDGHDLPPASVDLRYTNGIAVHWRQAGEAERDSNRGMDS
jgi:cell division protein FtsQ